MYWSNGRCCRVPWTLDIYGYFYCPPTLRCSRRSRRSKEGFEINNHISYLKILRQISITVGALILGGHGVGKSVEAFNPETRRHQCIPVCTVHSLYQYVQCTVCTSVYCAQCVPVCTVHSLYQCVQCTVCTVHSV